MNRTTLCRAVRSAALALVVPGLFVHQVDMATVQGEAIFAHALKVLQNDDYARYAKYDVVVSFTNGARHVDSWATTEDMTHASVYADNFSQQERENPFTPTGVNVGIGANLPDASARSFGANNGIPNTDTAVSAVVNKEGDSSDPVGPVAFAIDQNFGLTDPRPYVVVHEGETFSSRADGFTTIGRTRINEPPRYHVVLADTTGNVAHLTLTPLRDPFRNRLRELWVETDTGIVRQAIVAGVGDRSPIADGKFRITFMQVQGGTYISKIESITPIHFGDDDDVSDLTFTFENLVLTSDSPKYRFGISTPVQTLHDP
jgi:hypothetical protein